MDNSGFVDVPLDQVNEDIPCGSESTVKELSLPFMRIHSNPTEFYTPDEPVLIRNLPIQVKFMDSLNAPSANYIDHYLYTFQLTHGPFKWLIVKKHSNFVYLHQQLRIFQASLKVPLASRRYSTRHRSTHHGDQKSLPRISVKPDSLLDQDEIRERPHQLEEYLARLLMVEMFVEHEATLNFLEISRLSFISELGHKGLESYVQKKDGGRVMINCCIRAKYLLAMLAPNRRRRWLILKDTFVAYIHPKTGSIRNVLLMDQSFKATDDPSLSGDVYSVRISNRSRDLIIRCWTRRLAIDWVEAINKTAVTLCKDYTQSNRYGSFAPARLNTPCQWYVDGVSYFEAVAESLETAQEEIFITDWWLSPEIYMKRPIIHGDTWRLDMILRRKAEQGVKVFILLYKEFELALQIDSLYSKRVLMGLHSNIKVLRHPDIVKGAPIFWSHHEKMLIIDQNIAFISGIDLCYGRWDTFQHRLVDLGDISGKLSSSSSSTLNKSSVSLDKNLNNIAPPNRNSNEIGLRPSNNPKTESSSKPTPASNNGVIPNSYRIELNLDNSNKPTKSAPAFASIVTRVLSMQSNSNTTTNAAPNDSNNNNTTTSTVPSSTDPPNALPNVSTQTLSKITAGLRRLRNRAALNRNPSLDSIDYTPDSELRVAIKRTPSELGISNLLGGNKFWIGKDYCNYIIKEPSDFNRPFEDSIDRMKMPRLPWHDIGMKVKGLAARDAARHFIERWNFTKCSKAQFYDKYDWLLPKTTNVDEWREVVDPNDILPDNGPCDFAAECQIVRSVSDWSTGTKINESSIYEAYIDIIDNSMHYIYIENQFFITRSGGLKKHPREVINEVGEALVRRIIRAYRSNQVFRVFVIIPLLPAFEGELGTNSGANLEVITHWNMKSICRGSDSLIQRLSREIGDEVSQYITFFSLRNHSMINDRPITELIYVHSKIMLVDDRVALIGSSNINDRSLTGYRDSEVACVVRDMATEDGLMNGKPYQSGRFTGSLRRYLFREHLGLFDKNESNVSDRKGKKNRIDVRDPISDKFFNDVWLKIAKNNTKIYDTMFGAIPSDDIHTYEQLKQWKSKSWPVDKNPTGAKEKIAQIRGHLVIFPLNFLKNENLEPSPGTKASLVPQTVWT